MPDVTKLSDKKQVLEGRQKNRKKDLNDVFIGEKLVVVLRVRLKRKATF